MQSFHFVEGADKKEGGSLSLPFWLSLSVFDARGALFRCEGGEVMVEVL